MSGECMNTTIHLRFSMPFNESLEIRSNKPIDDEIGSDEEVEGIHYNIFWKGNSLPWTTKTQLQAIAIAMGCQWGAMETAKKVRFDER